MGGNLKHSTNIKKDATNQINKLHKGLGGVVNSATVSTSATGVTIDNLQPMKSASVSSNAIGSNVRPNHLIKERNKMASGDLNVKNSIAKQGNLKHSTNIKKDATNQINKLHKGL